MFPAVSKHEPHVEPVEALIPSDDPRSYGKDQMPNKKGLEWCQHEQCKNDDSGKVVKV